MQGVKKAITAVLAMVLAVYLSACSVPTPGFVDYDVSGYIRGLLDSSYHNDHKELMEIIGVTEEEARQNSIVTVGNAAVRFCNTYGISPSDEQLQELETVMKQAFALTRYTVKKERKVETGYYLEVEIASITNFENRGTDIEGLRSVAKQRASGSTGESSAAATPPPAVTETPTDPNELFVDLVLEFCKRELANISYDVENRTVALDILLTETGELQLDLNQIDTIDRTVIRF